MEEKDFLEFGPFRADLRHKALSRNGQPVPLPAKAFDVLCALLQRPGQTVPKDELMKEVWPDTFVEEGNLTQMVFLLRKALGESEGGQPVIVTVPRQGYRFVGGLTNPAAREVQTEASAAQPLSPAAAMAGERRVAPWAAPALMVGQVLARQFSRRQAAPEPSLNSLWWVGAAIMMVSGLGGWMIARYHFRESLPEPRLVRYIMPPEGKTASYRAGKVSPDGRSLALIGVDPSGKGQLWMRRLDALEAQPLAAAEAYPFWSPDSRFIAFVQDGKLKKIEATGGAPQTICTAPLVIGGSWNLDGTIVFGDGSAILRVPAKGGEPAPLTRLDASRGETTHDFPAFLPDGRHFLYSIHSRKRENGGIYVGSLDAPDARIRLLDDISNAEYAPGLHSGAGYLLFARGESLMAQPFAPRDLQLSGEAFPVVDRITRSPANLHAAFSASENGVLLVTSTYQGDQLAWFDRSGKRQGTIGMPGLHLNPQLSPDEQTVAVDENNAERFLSDIWLFPVGRETSSRLTLHGSDSALWSHDGSRIVFQSLNTAWYEKSVAGPENEALLLEGANMPEDYRLPCEWSRDGRFLIYSQWDRKTGFDLWMLPRFGNRKPVSFQHAEYNEWCGTLSPDGNWIAYAADESGRSEIYVQAFREEGAASERKWPVSNNGGHWPKWRRDGKELLYLDAERWIVGVEVKTDASFRHEAPQRLFPSGIRTPDARFDVTADGRRLLIPAAVTAADSVPATVILNWTKGIRP